MAKFGCPTKLVNIIASLRADNESHVILSGSLTDGFEVANGVRQGCVLAPLLFNIYITAILMIVDKELVDRGIHIRYRLDGGLFNLTRLRSAGSTKSRYVIELQYADNIMLLGNTAATVQGTKAYDAFHMEMSVEKTKSLQTKDTAI